MKAKLSKRTVDALRQTAASEGKTVYCYDTAMTGFGAYATAKGAAAYFVQYRLGGRGSPSKRLTIGKHGIITAEQARAIAREKLGEVAKGNDISAQRKDDRQRLATGSFREVAEKFLAANDRQNRYWHETRRLIEQNAYPAFGSQPISTITRGQIAGLIDETAARSKSVARLLFAALRPLFAWALERGIIQQNPTIGLRGPERVKARDRVLSENEISAFWQGADQLSWPFQPIFKLLLLTGQRREEVAGMTWRELDLENATWTIAKERAKNGKAHLVHLSPQALAVFDAFQSIHSDCPMVFSTTGYSAPSGFSKAKKRLDQHMATILGDDFEPWRAHDLRRTAASGMAALGIQPHIIERVLNHVSGAQGGLVGVYQRHEYLAERKAALEVWGARLSELSGIDHNM